MSSPSEPGGWNCCQIAQLWFLICNFPPPFQRHLDILTGELRVSLETNQRVFCFFLFTARFQSTLAVPNKVSRPSNHKRVPVLLTCSLNSFISFSLHGAQSSTELQNEGKLYVFHFGTMLLIIVTFSPSVCLPFQPCAHLQSCPWHPLINHLVFLMAVWKLTEKKWIPSTNVLCINDELRSGVGQYSGDNYMKSSTECNSV